VKFEFLHPTRWLAEAESPGKQVAVTLGAPGDGRLADAPANLVFGHRNVNVCVCVSTPTITRLGSSSAMLLAAIALLPTGEK
jgi:hypothetical protein